MEAEKLLCAIKIKKRLCQGREAFILTLTGVYNIFRRLILHNSTLSLTFGARRRMCGAERNEPIMLVMYNLQAVRQQLFYFNL